MMERFGTWLGTALAAIWYKSLGFVKWLWKVILVVLALALVFGISELGGYSLHPLIWLSQNSQISTQAVLHLMVFGWWVVLVLANLVLLLFKKLPFRGVVFLVVDLAMLGFAIIYIAVIVPVFGPCTGPASGPCF